MSEDRKECELIDEFEKSLVYNTLFIGDSHLVRCDAECPYGLQKRSLSYEGYGYQFYCPLSGNVAGLNMVGQNATT